jgi:hypothetical protein
MSTVIAAAALLLALVALALLIRDRRRHAREVAQLKTRVAGLRVDLTHHLNTSARWQS